MTSLTADNLTNMQQLIASARKLDRNEAETRHKIIDFILHDLLSWPRNRVAIEEYINPGFADYILKKENNDPLLFIEAKREGVYFELPLPHHSSENACFISIKKLITNDNIKNAMQQVRGYCVDSGCEYGCITNGHEWILFKNFAKGKRWDELQAYVIRRLEFFAQDYTKAINLLSFTAITENSSLATTLTSVHPKDRNIYYPKEKIPSYSYGITPNSLATELRPIANRYFGIIGDEDKDFMDKCYVSKREYQSAFEGMQGLMQDSLSPYFTDFRVKQLDDTGKGGALGGRLIKNLKLGRKGEVLVLFGGKGSGKSTFINRLLYHNPPRWLKEHSIISIVNLLNVPEDKTVIREYIWTSLLQTLDKEEVLKADRATILQDLFSDRFEIAKRQDLAGLKGNSEGYNIKLNELVSSWKQDYSYCSKKLAEYWSIKDKGVIVVIDNTDQYKSDIQDFCFTSAQEIANQLGCIALISMREERFHNSKIHGLLDAFQNSGFHISSPKPAEVFKKRLSYVVSILSDFSKYSKLFGRLEQDFVLKAITYFRILIKEFSNPDSPLNNFLTACAHGDTRLTLDLFRSFLLSGYTNVDEMISNGKWNFQVHQVLKPIMIPTRYFYDEGLSDIPNIFQLRSNRHSSHFTALRILRKLSKGRDKTAHSYHSAHQLRAYFSETFRMVEDYEKSLDVLLKHGLVEANNRLDYYSEDVDQIKITDYGMYMIEQLAFQFTYLDLVSTDCGIFDEGVNNHLTEAAKREFNLFFEGERAEKVKTRLDRAEKFLGYLVNEETRERDFYSLDMPENEMFTSHPKNEFGIEKERVLKSVLRQEFKKTYQRQKR